MSEDFYTALHQAEDSLEQAQLLLQNQFLGGSVNRAYYSYFWLVRGLLLEKNVNAKTHAGVHNKFAELYLKTGELPTHFGLYLSELFDARMDADYDLTSDLSEDDTRYYLGRSEEFLAYVKAHYG
jgi:uncharacterized protein (UPF0332 family)